MNILALRRIPVLRGQEAGLVGVLVVLSLGFGFFNSSFLTTDNVRNVFVAVAVVGIMSVGECFVIIAGDIDLSVGSVLGLSGLCGAYLMAQGMNPVLGIALGICVGAMAGLLTGLIVVFGKVSSFIVTLGMLSVARGLTEVISGGLPITVSDDVAFIGQGEVFGIPVQVLIFLGLVVLGQFVLTRSVLGQRVLAIGDNAEAARLSGIPPKATRVTVFVIGGALAGVAGIVYTCQVGVAEAQAGTGLELDVIAAVVIGGASLAGGRGSIVGAMLGAYLLGALRNAFILLELSPFLQQMSVGLVIVLATVFDQFRQGAFRRPRAALATGAPQRPRRFLGFTLGRGA
jgi:ribose/xylose/arabinose/galactoside ABC-type transport system permease subunit